MNPPAIREALEARGWSQAATGQVLGLDQPSVSKRLRGATSWKVSEIKTLADELGCTVDDLLGDSLPDAVRDRLRSLAVPAATAEAAS